MKYITPVARAILSDPVREAQQGDISPIHQSWESIVPLNTAPATVRQRPIYLFMLPNNFLFITDDDIFMITLNICTKTQLFSSFVVVVVVELRMIKCRS